MFKLLIYLIILTAIISCNNYNKKPDIEKVMADLMNKYPQLPKGTGKPSEYYKLDRTVIIGEKSIELQLRSMPNNILHDQQKIILVINPVKEVYAIPFFSNTYHDYWNFQFDSTLASVKSVNTTFENELRNCLQTLKLNDTKRTAHEVVYELLISLLQCEPVSEGDSLKLHELILTTNYSLSNENMDSCSKRIQKNWDDITKGFHQKEVSISKIKYSYLDRLNSRVYQFDFKDMMPPKNFDFNIKTYRQDCILSMMRY